MIPNIVPSTPTVRAVATPQVFSREGLLQWITQKTKGSIGTLESVPDSWRSGLIKRGLIVRTQSGFLVLCTEFRVVPLQSIELTYIKQGIMVFLDETTVSEAA